MAGREGRLIMAGQNETGSSGFRHIQSLDVTEEINS